MARWASDEPLVTQFYFRIDPKLYPTESARKWVKAQAKRIFFHTGGEGQMPVGVELGIRWRNPENMNERHANWKSSDDAGQSLPDAYQTLRPALEPVYQRTLRELREVRREPVKRILPPEIMLPSVKRKLVKPPVKRKLSKRKRLDQFMKRSKAAKLGWKRRRQAERWVDVIGASKTKARKKPAKQSKTTRKRVPRKTRRV